MNKIEFSDINKFFTSLGLILIGLSILLPWFINQNEKILLIDKSKIDNLSPAAKEIVIKQQYYLLTLNTWLPWIILTLIVVGIVLLIYGLSKWKVRQEVIDKIQDEELKSKQQQNLSPEERKAIKENELEETKPEDINSAVRKYISIEDRIYSKLLPYYQVNYNTSNNIRIGPYNYDIMLKSKFINVVS